MQVASFQRWEYCKSGSLCEPFSCVLLPVLAHFSIFQSYAPRNAGITGFYCIASATREIKSARTVLIKAMISSFYQYHSGYFTVIKNHTSAMYWFKPLTFACHRIPEKNGHIKVITSAYATLTCPFSPGMG